MKRFNRIASGLLIPFLAGMVTTAQFVAMYGYDESYEGSWWAVVLSVTIAYTFYFLNKDE